MVAARSEGRRGGAEAVMLPGRWRRQPTRDDRGGGESQQASLDAWTRGIVSGFGSSCSPGQQRFSSYSLDRSVVALVCTYVSCRLDRV